MRAAVRRRGDRADPAVETRRGGGAEAGPLGLPDPARRHVGVLRRGVGAQDRGDAGLGPGKDRRPVCEGFGGEDRGEGVGLCGPLRRLVLRGEVRIVGQFEAREEGGVELRLERLHRQPAATGAAIDARPVRPVQQAVSARHVEIARGLHRHQQRHTAKRVYDRLREEHGFTGGYTIIKDYIRERERRGREMFVPLAHPPGDAQADFGEAVVIIDGIEQKAHFFVLDLPHSDACFVRAYPAATAEAWMDGHVHAFAFFGGVPQSVLYDNDRCLVSKILADGTRKRATLFSALQSHYLVWDRYGRPGKGNDKGKVEGIVGYARRNFIVPVPRFASWEAFNADLEAQCRNRQNDILRGHKETIGERLQRDLAAMKPLPGAPFEACAQASGQVSSQSLVRYETNDYSVPVAYGHQDVWVRGYVDQVVIGCRGDVIARHPRCYAREDVAEGMGLTSNLLHLRSLFSKGIQV